MQVRLHDCTVVDLRTKLLAEVGQAGLGSLTALDLSRCTQLTSVEGLRGLTSLTTLNLRGCERLAELPEALFRLPYLTALNIEQCTGLQKPRYDVARRGLSRIREYFDAYNEGAAISNTLKLVFVGDGNAGKTSLQQSWAANCQPRPVRAHARTINLQLDEALLSVDANASVRLHSPDAPTTKVNFACWDFGGQLKSYAAIQQAYLSCGALHVLVIHPHKTCTPEDERDLHRWLDFLQARAPGAVVQPIVSHADLLDTADGRGCGRGRGRGRQQPEHTADRVRAWLRARFTAHRDAHAAEQAASANGDGDDADREQARATASVLSIKDDNIPCVSSSAGSDAGDGSLRAALRRLLELCDEPRLLPVIGQPVLLTWEACKAVVFAVHDGVDPFARARAAIFEALGRIDDGRRVRPRFEATEPQQRAYMQEVELRQLWWDVAAYLAEVLDEQVSDKPVLVDTLRSASGGHILDDTLKLLSDQGLVFVSSGLVFLDASFATRLVAPLVDHLLPTRLTEWVDIPSVVRPFILPQIQLLTERGELQPALLRVLWRNLIADERWDADSPRAIELLKDAGLLLEEQAGALRVRHLGDTRYWLLPMRLPTDAPPTLDQAWPPLGAEGQTVRFELCEQNTPIPAFFGIAERCVAGAQKLAGVVCTWRSGVVLGAPANPMALLRVQAREIVLEIRATDAAGGNLLHRLMSLVQSVVDDYSGKLRFRIPQLPSNQGVEGTCVAHSIAKIVTDQLWNKYLVGVNRKEIEVQLIQASGCLNGPIAVADAVQSINDDLAKPEHTGFRTLHGQRYKISLVSSTRENFEDLKCAVHNSHGWYHIVTGSSEHAVIADSLSGPHNSRVRCVNSWGDNSYMMLAAQATSGAKCFHSCHILETTITAAWRVNSQGTGEWRDAPLPPVTDEWARRFPNSQGVVAHLLPIGP